MTQHTPTRPVRIGVQMHPQHTTYQSFADGVRHFEDIGVDTIFNWDHFFPLYGDPQGPHFEGWTLLTAMATLTSRAEVGCLVTCNTYRNPALLSDMAKTVDHISNGRLILGIGAGWFERDYSEYGYEFGTAGGRLAALEHSLEVITHRWQVDEPKPTRAIPILVGGGGEKVTLRITAKYASIWHGFGSPDVIAHKMEVLDNWCKEIGRDPHEIERAAAIDRSSSEADMEAIVKAGATHLIVGHQAPWAFDDVKRIVQWRNAFNG